MPFFVHFHLRRKIGHEKKRKKYFYFLLPEAEHMRKGLRFTLQFRFEGKKLLKRNRHPLFGIPNQQG